MSKWSSSKAYSFLVIPTGYSFLDALPPSLPTVVFYIFFNMKRFGDVFLLFFFFFFNLKCKFEGKGKERGVESEALADTEKLASVPAVKEAATLSTHS